VLCVFGSIETLGLFNACMRVFPLLMSSFSRFHSIMYNSDAIQAEETSSEAGLSSDDAIFLHPLKFDEEVIAMLSSFTTLV
jgi:hypothetical protein